MTSWVTGDLAIFGFFLAMDGLGVPGCGWPWYACVGLLRESREKLNVFGVDGIERK